MKRETHTRVHDDLTISALQYFKNVWPVARKEGGVPLRDVSGYYFALRQSPIATRIWIDVAVDESA